VPKRPSRTFAVFSLCAALALTTLALTYRASQWVPPFYEQLQRAEPVGLASFGDEFERELLELHNAWEASGQWSGIFTDEQINGWLAMDMQEKFPILLPTTVKDPRIAIKDSQAHLACQYVNGGVSAVLSMVVDVSLTERPNEVALRLRTARIGAVPGLMRQAMQKISVAAIRSGIPIYWKQIESDPVAIVRIPAGVFELGKSLVIESLELTDGRLAVAGRVNPLEEDSQVQQQSAESRPDATELPGHTEPPGQASRQDNRHF